MNTLQAISKCQKKAWHEIKTIQNANNFLEVEQAISDAIEKTFGLYHNGLLLVRMKKLGEMGQLEGEKMIRIRRSNFDRHASNVRHYLSEMIPARFTNTMMYKKYTGQM